MASLNTGGFALSALPTAPDVPQNIGRFSPSEAMSSMTQAMDVAERWRTLKAAQKLHNAEMNRAIAEHEATLQALPEETKARVSLAQGTQAQTPLKTRQMAVETKTAEEEAPSKILSHVASNMTAIEQARTAYLTETDPAVRAAKIGNYKQQLEIARKNGIITDAAYGQMLNEAGLGQNAPQTPPQPNPTANAVTQPAQAAEAPAVQAAGPLSAPPQSSSQQLPLAGSAPVAPNAASAGRISLGGQPSIVAGGGLFASTTNPVTGQIVNRFVTPEGIQYKTANADSNALAYQQKTEANLLAAGLDPQNYKDASGMIRNPAAALKEAYAKTSTPTIPSTYLGSDVRNPVAGLEPTEANKEMAKRREADGHIIASEVVPAIENGQMLNANMDRMQELLREHPSMTGYFQKSKIVNGLMQLGSEALAAVKGDPTLASAMQEFEALHNQSITAIMRYRPEASSGGPGGGAGTSQSGIGRVLQTEVPWFASASPDMISEAMTNINKANRVKAAVNAISSHAQYLADVQNELGFIPAESTKHWTEYRKANPAFDAKGNPIQNMESPDQYFARVKTDPKQAGKPAVPTAPTPTATAQAGSQPAQQSHPTVSTQAEFDALPSKAYFVTPSGKMRQKP